MRYFLSTLESGSFRSALRTMMHSLLNKQSVKTAITDGKNQNTALPGFRRNSRFSPQWFRYGVRPPQPGATSLLNPSRCPFSARFGEKGRAENKSALTAETEAGETTFLNELMAKIPANLSVEGEERKERSNISNASLLSESHFSLREGGTPNNLNEPLELATVTGFIIPRVNMPSHKFSGEKRTSTTPNWQLVTARSELEARGGPSDSAPAIWYSREPEVIQLALHLPETSTRSASSTLESGEGRKPNRLVGSSGLAPEVKYQLNLNNIEPYRILGTKQLGLSSEAYRNQRRHIDITGGASLQESLGILLTSNITSSIDNTIRPAKSVDFINPPVKTNYGLMPTSTIYLAMRLKDDITANEQIGEMFSTEELNKLYLSVKVKDDSISATLRSDDRLIAEKLVSAASILQQMVRSESSAFSPPIINEQGVEFTSSFPVESIRAEGGERKDFVFLPPSPFPLPTSQGERISPLPQDKSPFSPTDSRLTKPRPESLWRDLTDLESTRQELREVISDEPWGLQSAPTQANENMELTDEARLPAAYGDKARRLSAYGNYKIRVRITPDNVHFKVEADKPVAPGIRPASKLEADVEEAEIKASGLATPSLDENAKPNFLSVPYVVSKLAERLTEHLREKIAQSENWQIPIASEELKVEFIAANPPSADNVFPLVPEASPQRTIELVEPENNSAPTEAASPSGEFRIIIPDNKFSLLPQSLSVYETTLNIPGHDEKSPLSPFPKGGILGGEKQTNPLETPTSELFPEPVTPYSVADSSPKTSSREAIPRALQMVLEQIPQLLSNELQNTVSPVNAESKPRPTTTDEQLQRYVDGNNDLTGVKLRVIGDSTGVKFQLIGNDTTQENIDSIAEKLRTLLADDFLKQTGFNWRKVDVMTQSSQVKASPVKGEESEVQSELFGGQRLYSENFSAPQNLSAKLTPLTAEPMLQADVASFPIGDNTSYRESAAQPGFPTTSPASTENFDAESWELVMELTSEAPSAKALGLNTAPGGIEFEKTVTHLSSSIVNALIASSEAENRNDLLQLKLPDISWEDISSLELNIKRDATTIDFFISSDKSLSAEKQAKLASVLPKLLEQEIMSANAQEANADGSEVEPLSDGRLGFPKFTTEELSQLKLEVTYDSASNGVKFQFIGGNQSLSEKTRELMPVLQRVVTERLTNLGATVYPDRGDATRQSSHSEQVSNSPRTNQPSIFLKLGESGSVPQVEPRFNSISVQEVPNSSEVKEPSDVENQTNRVLSEGRNQRFEPEIILKLFSDETPNVEGPNIHSQMQNQVSRAETILKNLSGLISSLGWDSSKQNGALTPEVRLAELQAIKADVSISNDGIILKLKEGGNPSALFNSIADEIEQAIDKNDLAKILTKTDEGGEAQILVKEVANPTANTMTGNMVQEQSGISYTKEPVDVQNIVEEDELPELKVESTRAKTEKGGEVVEQTTDAIEVEPDSSHPKGLESPTVNAMNSDKTQGQSDAPYPEEPVKAQNIGNRIRTEILERVHARTSFATETENEYREIRLQLIPERLGKIVIRVSQDNDVVSAHIQTNTPAAKEIIESELSQLKEELTNQGINIEELNVSVGRERSGFNFQQGSRRNPTSATLPNRSSQNEEANFDDSPAQDVYESSIVNLIA